MDDWLAEGLSGRSERTLTLYLDWVKPLTDKIGARQLRKLTAAEVRSALNGLSGELSTRSLQIARNCLVRAIRQAQADDIVTRNVAALVKRPGARAGRPRRWLRSRRRRWSRPPPGSCGPTACGSGADRTGCTGTWSCC